MRLAAGRAGLLLVFLAASVSGARAGGLTGTVTDADSGGPLEGATVSVATPAGAALATVSTDASGRYALEVQAGGALVLRATAPGYQPRFYAGDRFRGQPLTVSRGAEIANGDIALPRAAEITGTVWRRDGSPLFPGYVVLNPVGEYRYNYNVATTRDGSYRFDDVPAGSYYLSAMAYDTVARQLVGPGWYWPGSEDMNAREPLVLTLGVPSRIDIRMEGDKPEPNWVGLVTDEAGQPLPGVQLMILRVVQKDGGSEEAQHVSVRRTDAQGRCELDRLQPGRYRVSTTDVPPPYAPWRNPDRKARGAGVYARDFGITAEAQAVTEMQLAPGRTLQVRLREASGAAAPEDAAVSLVLWHRGDEPFGGDGFFSRPERVGRGELQVRGLLPGATYDLRLNDRDDRARWCVARVRGAQDRTVVVPAAGEPAPLEIRVRRCPVR